jgi:SAM-dependent methyltransferase
MTPDNKYTAMQKSHYEITADEMNRTGNHRHHDANPDYWDILLGDVKRSPKEWAFKRAFDFGCGQGRNIINLLKLGQVGGLTAWASVDGGDIAQGNLDYAAKNIASEMGVMDRTKLYLLNGVELNGVPSDEYHFVMSTIVLQHIPVYTIRRKILSEFYRILKPGGMVSFQMGFDYKLKPVGGDRYMTRDYYEDYVDATTTNGRQDVSVTNLEQIGKDLKEIGFGPSTIELGPPFSDEHDKWVYARAVK